MDHTTLPRRDIRRSAAMRCRTGWQCGYRVRFRLRQLLDRQAGRLPGVDAALDIGQVLAADRRSVFRSKRAALADRADEDERFVFGQLGSLGEDLVERKVD